MIFVYSNLQWICCRDSVFICCKLNLSVCFYKNNAKMNKNSISNINTRRKLGSLGGKNSAAVANKNPTNLTQHTNKIEEKLAKLRSQIDDKKKTSAKDIGKKKNTDKPLPNQFNAFIKTAGSSKMNISKQKIPAETIKGEMEVCNDLRDFLQKIGMQMYVESMCENGIDSFQILQQCKQKQLQELGIPKGHALKIAIHIKKSSSKVEKVRESTHQSQPKKIKLEGKKSQPLQIIIQTDDLIENEPLQRKRRYFCLYCYQLCRQKQFCGDECQQLYNNMFKKYEDNLKKAEKLFIHEQKSQINSQQNEEQQGDEDEAVMQYLLEKQQKNNQDSGDQQFDEEAFEEMRKMVANAERQTKNKSSNFIGLKMLQLEEEQGSQNGRVMEE